MKHSLSMAVLCAAASACFGQDAAPGSPKAKDGEILAEITAEKALSFTGDQGQTITELSKPTVKLFRSGKVKSITLTGDTATTESQPGKGLRKVTLKGNVRAEERDGTVTTADEAVIDLDKGISTYTGRSIRIVAPEK